MPTLLSGLITLLLAMIAAPRVALAHSSDAYLQAAYITVASAQIEVELNLTPGVLVAPQILRQLDADGNQEISDAEGRAYADGVVRKVLVQVDGQPLALAVTKIEVPPYLTVQAGYATLRIFTTAQVMGTTIGAHQLYFKNNFVPVGAVYQVNVFVGKGEAVTLGKPSRDSVQQSMTLDYSVGSVASTTRATRVMTDTTGPANLLGIGEDASGQTRQLMAYLYEPVLSPWVLLVALGLAGVLGGLHALTPGHGKTLVAAYLVGSRGTVRHAVLLGTIVTLTHTLSVIVIGLLALFASQFVVPNVLVPILEILSGLLVVFMGMRLVWQRWVALRSGSASNHTHAHDQNHSHAPGDGPAHSHVPPAGTMQLSNLMAMGISGGLVPCPEALGIMVIAIGLNRIVLGLGLIVSFSVGLAVVLIVIGILLVRSRTWVERFGNFGGRWRGALPLISALIVLALGLGIALRGLARL